jgi:hypothetical protein
MNPQRSLQLIWSGWKHRFITQGIPQNKKSVLENAKKLERNNKLGKVPSDKELISAIASKVTYPIQ